jgi:hypothetical protein
MLFKLRPFRIGRMTRPTRESRPESPSPPDHRVVCPDSRAPTSAVVIPLVNDTTHLTDFLARTVATFHTAVNVISMGNRSEISIDRFRPRRDCLTRGTALSFLQQSGPCQLMEGRRAVLTPSISI